MVEFIKKQKKILLLMFVVVLFFWQPELFGKALSFVFALLSPFLIAGAFAFIVNLPISFIERKIFFNKRIKKPLPLLVVRPLSLLLSLLFFVAIIVFAMLVVIPQLTTTVATLGDKIEAFMPTLVAYLSKISDNPEFLEFVESINFDEIKTNVINFLKTGVIGLFDSTLTVASGVVSFVSTMFISVVFAIYILISKEKLASQFTRSMNALFAQSKTNKILKVLSMTKNAFANFITGQSIEAIILGLLMLMVLLLFRIPFALLIAVVIGFTSLVPIVGAFVGAGIGAFLILIVSPIQAIYFLVIFIVVQQIEGNIIYPRVVGNSIGLPGMWVLAAVSVGATLAGVVGILLCIPLASVAYLLFKEFVEKKEANLAPKKSAADLK